MKNVMKIMSFIKEWKVKLGFLEELWLERASRQQKGEERTKRMDDGEKDT